VIAEYVHKRKTLSLAQAVHKMTWLTAQTIGLDALKRGRVHAGYKADLLVFDPTRIADHATYEKPSRRAEGMDWVLVNGRSVWKNGKRTSTRSGRVLLRPKAE
jgi:N-acyl-D-aspartate/D-glutamate deacylase